MSNEQKTVQEVNLPTLWSRIKSYVNSRIPKGSLAGKDIAPLDMGGTNATNAKDARVNLGITYGTEIPIDAPETGSGTVYFFEDGYTPMSIVEGGTGANNKEDALVNLGLSVVDITDEITLTKTSGSSTFNILKAVKYGSIVFMSCYGSTTASISSGSDIWVGTMNKYLPVHTARGAGYSSATCQVGSLTSEGGFIVRQTGGNLGSTVGFAFSLTYITEE